MLSIHHFLRYSSPGQLQAYFSYRQYPLASIDWEQPFSEVLQSLLNAIDCLSAKDKVCLAVDAERIDHMSYTHGQSAIAAIVGTHPIIDAMTLPMDKSSWLYQHVPEQFRHAEDIRYADHYRHQRHWSAYQVAPGLVVSTDQPTLSDFAGVLNRVLAIKDEVVVERFERSEPKSDDDCWDANVVQVMVFSVDHNGSHHSQKAHHRHPSSDYAIIYSARSGQIDIVASHRSNRDRIATAFIQILLDQAVVDPLPRRCYNLQPLMMPGPLSWDPDDAIEDVQVVSLTLKDLSNEVRLTVQRLESTDTSLHTYLTTHFGHRSPLTSHEFVPVKASILIRFYPSEGRHYGRVLPITIILPNDCDLRSRTRHEQQIGEKYLQRWGLLSEVEA